MRKRWIGWGESDWMRERCGLDEGEVDWMIILSRFLPESFVRV